jgi:hypothetical protein
MRAVIRTNDVKIEFSGRGQVWNELLRPHFGGPEAPPEPETPAAPPAAVRATPAVQLTPHRGDAPSPVRPAAPPAARPVAGPAQPRTWYPPREQPPRRFEPEQPSPQSYHSAEEDDGDGVRVEPSSDPATLYGRLAALPGRRSERDAVLAAVWFLTKGETETTGDDVERHFATFRAFPDVKVVPHLLKHVHRTKMLEFGSTTKTVRLSKKGLAYVVGRLVPD